jgi:hypothetical protein
MRRLTFRRAFLDHSYPIKAIPPQPVTLARAHTLALAGSDRSTRMFSTTFGKVMRLMGGNQADVVVTANADGTFTTRCLGAGPLEWVPLAALVLAGAGADRASLARHGLPGVRASRRRDASAGGFAG